MLTLADSAISLKTNRYVFTNPFDSDKYPLSYSVLYENRLVSLFAPGQFSCRNVKSWLRDEAMERTLNTYRFDRFWLIDGSLVATSAQKTWRFDAKRGWVSYAKELPMANGLKMFEDDRYLVYATCNGEFGGRIYFVNKQTQRTHSTESTCAIWVRRTAEGYEIVSSLGHGVGSAEITLVRAPDKLPVVGESPPAPAIDANVVTLFSGTGIQLFGGLVRNNTVYYLTDGPVTTLSTRAGNVFTVVHPLFNERLYTHTPVTTNYNGTHLINMDFYGEGGELEVACLLIDADTVTLIDWHTRHRY